MAPQARHELERQGGTRRVKARQAWHDKSRSGVAGKTCCGMERQGRRGKARLLADRQDVTR
jgi:hypothetical protein